MNPRQLFSQRRTAQAVIWLFAALMVAFVALAGVDHGSGTQTYGQEATLASTPSYAAGDSADLSGNFFTTVEGLSAGQASEYTSDDNEWLPAYRWQGSFQLQSQPDGGLFGMGNLDESIVSGLSSMLFAIAGFFWTILLGLTKWAFSTDLVEMLGEKINFAAAGLAESFGTAGVIAIMVLILMVSVGASVVGGGKKGKGPQAAFRNVALFVVPIAAMQVMTANPGAAEGTRGYNVSPVGLADRGSEVVNDIVFQVTTPLTASSLADPAEDAHKQPSDKPNCEYYYARLYGTYHNVVEWENDKHEAALVLVSRMWEATMLRSFTEAQYGVYEEGRYAVCHQLESQRGTDPTEQSAIADGPRTPYSKMQLDTRDEEGSVFGEAGQSKHQIAYYLAWMACRDGDAGAWKNAETEDRLEHADCSTWWSDGFDWDSDGGRFSPAPTAEDALTFDDAGDEGPAAKLGGTSTTEYEVVSTFMSGKGRFALAATSVVTAGAYLVAVGGLAIGTIVATVLLALLLIFSPVMLLLLALPSKNGNRNQLGVRMLRMTGTTLLAKLTFYLSITVVVILINMLNGLVV